METIETEKKYNDLSIIIENFEFTLIYKTIAFETGVYEPRYNLPPIIDEISRIVKIKSLNLDTREEYFFWVYLSLSELGVWRFLCYDKPMSTRYDKGKEYVQSTCVNMYLQKHIHLFYDRLDEIVSPHEDLANISRSQPGFTSITEQNINISQEYINRHSFVLHDSNREKYLLDNKNIPVKCGITTRTTEENVIKQIQSTSKYLEDNYIIIGHEELFRYNFIFRDVINSNNIVMKVTLKNKNTDDSIILFYKKMFFSKLNSIAPPSREQIIYDKTINSITNDGNTHFVVILVIPMTAHCLSNSLYSEYIHLGIYVCKPFEYTSGLNSRTTQCTKDYSYVGYRYENIFPIKNIENGLVEVKNNINQVTKKNEESKDVAGGKRSKRSKRKNINNNSKRKSKKNKKTKRKYKKNRKSTKKV
jgi:hypothetical protein